MLSGKLRVGGFGRTIDTRNHVARAPGGVGLGRELDPADRADRLAFHDHPYGRPIKGTKSSITAISPDDLRDYTSRVFARDKLEIAVPPLSILAEPPVALVDHWVDKHGTREVAQAYLDYLYSPAGQRLAAKNYYRPISPEKADPADVARFPTIELFRLDQVFGSWQQAQQTHFNDGGVFDQIYVPSAGPAK